MRPYRVAWVVLLGPGSAWAADLRLTASTTIVPGQPTPGITVPTDTGPVAIGAEADPTFRFGLGARAGLDLAKHTRGTASWGLYRVQALCDTCASGEGPGWLGSELLRSTDLGLELAHTEPLGPKASVVLSATALLPASRAAWSCDPFYGAPGAGATFRLPVRGSTVSLGVSARRPFYRFDAAPVGRCAPALRDGEVATLTGPVEATPWDGGWFAAPNPTLSGGAELRWTDPHALIHPVKHLATALSLGLEYTRSRPAAATTIHTDTGPVEIPYGSNPVRTAVPWALEVGWELGSRWTVAGTVSNRVPTLLTDPGGTLRAAPGTTAFGLAASANF